MAGTVLQNTMFWEAPSQPGDTYGFDNSGPAAHRYDNPNSRIGSSIPVPAHLTQKKFRGPSLNSAARAELVVRYRKRIDAAKKMREVKNIESKWHRFNKLYANKHWPETMGYSEEDRITVGLIFSTINVILPSVTVNHPKIVVNSQHPETESQAIIIEGVINYWWRHFDIKPEFQLAVKDYLVFGFGWIKTGYRFVQEEAPCSDADLIQRYQEQMQQVVDYHMQNPEAVQQAPAPTPDEVAASIPTTDIVTVEDRPFAVRVSPFDIFVDPEATNPRNMRWIAQRVVKTLEEVKGNPQYDRKARDNIKAGSQLNPAWRNDQVDFRAVTDDYKRVEIWEFYDLHNHTMAVFADGADDFLVRPIWQPYAFGHPFLMLRNYEVPDEFYPMGEVEALESLNLEIDKLRSQAMNHRKRYTPKYVYKPDLFDQNGVAALESDEPNTLVPVLGGPQVPMSEAIAPLAQVALPPELYKESEQIEADLDRVSGVNEYQRGTIPESRRTATEASLIQDAANARVSDKLAHIEEFISQVGSRLLKLAQQYMTKDQVARVVGKDYGAMWVTYTRDMIQGEYDFTVEGGSTQPRNEMQKHQQALNMLQTFGPLFQTGIINVPALIEYVLKDGFNIPNPKQFLNPPPDPNADQQSPTAKIIESMNYKDAPADIQRQIEAAAGMQPSTESGSSPQEVMATQGQHKLQQEQLKGQTQLAKVTADHVAKGHELGLQHVQAATALAQTQQHEHATLGLQHAHEAHQAHLDALAKMQQQLATPLKTSQSPEGGSSSERHSPQQKALLDQLAGQVGAPVGSGSPNS